MNEVQTIIAQLQEKGWTLVALADELGVTVNAVEKWKAGDRKPTNEKSVFVFLDQLLKRKRIPKKRRYSMGSRKFATGDKVIGNAKKASYWGKSGVVVGYHRATNESQIRLNEDGAIHYVSPSWFDRI